MQLLLLGFGIVVEVAAAASASSMNDLVGATLKTQNFYQVPGPNPILTVGSNTSWDGLELECAGGVYQEYDRYYLIYHATGVTDTRPDAAPGAPGYYQVGGATASHPLGPWTKMPTNPLLSPGAEGEWDHGMVASATILKMGPSNWTMWYEATPGGFGPHMGRWSVGLAHATSPEGPWKKASAVNPIINESIVGFDGFYVAAVIEVNGSIWMYAEAPIVANDYGPLALFTADRPEGPYTNRGPVLVGGGPGQWDHTQYSESKVAYREGVFHLFFSAGSTPPGDPDPGSLTAKRHQARGGGGGGGRRSERRRLGDAWETTGYAFSFDGLHFDRNINNPVMRRQADPNVHRNSEPHIFMPGGNLLYVYHTMRFSDLSDHAGEDIGVEVLSHTPSFRLPMPVVDSLSLAPSKVMTCLAPGWCDYVSKTIALTHVSTVSFTVSWDCSRYSAATSAAADRTDVAVNKTVQLSVHTSADGTSYDSVPVFERRLQQTVACSAPQTRWQLTTEAVALPGLFAKVQLANLVPRGTQATVSNVSVVATLIGSE